MVVDIEDLKGLNSVRIAGRKNAGLSEMVRIGVLIPRGFCITTLATDVFISSAALQGKITRILHTIDFSSLRSIESGSKRLRTAIERSELPSFLHEAILGAYRHLGDRLRSRNPEVSVRSSAMAEDMIGFRFAGAYESLLYVSGAQNLLTSVKRCISSMYTPEALSLRNELGMSQTTDAIGMSVGVFEMINARVSGTAFTTDLSTKNDNLIVIEANYGIPISVVDGLSDVDQIALRKSDLKIVRVSVGKKRFAVMRGVKGTSKTEEIPPPLRNRLALSNVDIVRIGQYALRIEKHFGVTLDLEWAIADSTNKIYFLQARPLESKGVMTGPELGD